MAAATKTAGFTLPCPHCGAVADDDGVGGLAVRLADLTVECPVCGEAVTRADLTRLASEVARLLRWIDLAATA